MASWYKGLWHLGCNFFLTTTINSELVYVYEEIPFDRVCPECNKEIEETERQFGRNY
jgi:hypothetical protein